MSARDVWLHCRISSQSSKLLVYWRSFVSALVSMVRVRLTTMQDDTSSALGRRSFDPNSNRTRKSVRVVQVRLNTVQDDASSSLGRHSFDRLPTLRDGVSSSLGKRSFDPNS